MKKWQQPVLEVLDVKQTMMGPGTANVDFLWSDEDESVELHYS
ncbi:paeninodin family lasso peptide [Radiobacillus sp. PE A8.2]